MERENKGFARSIFEYYSVENDRAFVRDHCPDKLQACSYVEGNIRNFLHEFVNHTDIARVSYFLAADRFYYLGIQDAVGESYKKTAHQRGEASREQAEWKGFHMLEHAFARQEADTAFWISPPSDEEGFGDYGFMFVFVKEDGGRITEYIVRYPEKKGSLLMSLKLSEYIGHSGYRYSDDDNLIFPQKTEKDFLESPFLFKSDGSSMNLDNVLSRLGFTLESLEEAYAFDALISRELGGWIRQYAKTIMEGDSDSATIEEGKKLLTAIYNRTGILKQWLREGDKDKRTYLLSNTVLPESRFGYPSDHTLIAYFSSKKALVEGGGSCPVSRFSSSISSSLSDFSGKVDYSEATLLTEGKNGWSYREGECRECKKKDVLVGPCDLCTTCELKYD